MIDRILPSSARIGFLTAWLVVLAASSGWAQDASTPPEDPEQFHLFLLAGQSNMAGRGEVAPQDRQPHPRVWMLDQQKRWAPAADPLHFDKPPLVGVGLGKSFAVAYAAAHPSVHVGLVPCAVGGSPIAAWQPGGYHAQTDSHPYDDALQRIRAADSRGTWKGILWHQGESDSQPGLSQSYAAKLTALVERLREAVGDPEVPFLVGQMGQFPERPWDEDRRRVDRAHRLLHQRVDNAAFVSSAGLTHKGDEIHFDAASYRRLGDRYFEAFQQLTAEDDGYRVERDIPYRDDEDESVRGKCQLDLYYPSDRKEFATVVWFHGGGLTSGRGQIPDPLRHQGVAVAAVDYRLSPDVAAKTCIEDAAAAVAWVLDEIESYGGSSEAVFISGHSAGGYLTSMIGLDRSYLAAHDVDADRVAGLIPLSGHTITHFTVRQERGIPKQQPVVDEMAPLYHVRADAPPMLLITGDREREMLGRYEENAYLWRMMQAVGHPSTTLHELDGFDHGGMVKPGLSLLLAFVKDVQQRSGGEER